MPFPQSEIGCLEVTALAKNQSALRRVSTLVAQGAAPAEIFRAAAEEVGRLLEIPYTAVIRFEADETITLVGGWGRFVEVSQSGTRVPLHKVNVAEEIARSGDFAFCDRGVGTTGLVRESAKHQGIGTAAGSPIVVTGRVWGAVIVAAGEGSPLPLDVEQQLNPFTELVAIGIAAVEARAELTRLVDEHAALRRVATLVAENRPASRLFAKVAEEVASLLGRHVNSAILRYEPDGTATVLATYGETPPGGIQVDARLPVDGSGVTARVYRERCPVRIDNYCAASGVIADHAKLHGFRAAVGCPILVQGRLWGTMFIAHHEPEPFPSDTEQRVSQFTELVATAIANTQAQTDLQRLLDEQASLRRLATLVAQGARPPEVFEAVVAELRNLFGLAEVGLIRADSPHEVTILAHRGQPAGLVRPGMRVPLDGDSATARVLRTRRSARVDFGRSGGEGTIADLARRSNHGVAIAAPVVVDGQLWGALTASWRVDVEPPRGDVEQRLAEFAELVVTTIANAESHNQLTASRARVLSAGDEARRRVVRDLHDGAQQRLVHTIITLKLAQRALGADTSRVRSLLDEALGHAEQGNADLRELAHGILPSILTRGGLRAGVASVVSRLDLSVDTDVTSTRMPPKIEASGYFIIAEALTNVVKHAQATKATVRAAISASTLHIEITDDGFGGADPEGHGLTGISDRAAALGGSLHIDSPEGVGTTLRVQLPLPA
ncbi:GAF domain-containing protein [Streptomyces sp. NPDC101209]|uniref:GAF domain-containing protein n=1 Tax=Streptomyces sp. NPDC101209 TaxID=3366129 RepID=UPI003805A67A